jgi:hypothetical protein
LLISKEAKWSLRTSLLSEISELVITKGKKVVWGLKLF